MTTFELIISFILGIATLICALWFVNAKGKLIILFVLNSIIASIILVVCSVFASEYFKLNAFSLYTSGFLGFVGLVVTFVCNAF